MLNSGLVLLGGAFGAIARYLIGIGLMRRFPNPPFPMAMLLVNIGGSFGLGLLMSQYIRTETIYYHEPFYLYLGIGFFGAFTTFSTFSIETVQLLRERHYIKAALYVFITVFFAIILFSLAMMIFT